MTSDGSGGSTRPVPQPTKLSRLLLSHMNAHIDYCHFKSNEHLEAGLNGKTDLDILVDRNSYEQFQAILSSLGFKRISRRGAFSPPSNELHLGFDHTYDQFVLLHVHYDLILGDRLKQYHVPWGEYLFQNSVVKDNSVRVVKPEVELFLLLVRYALKSKPYHRLLPKHRLIPESTIKEYEWLIERCDINDVLEVADDLLVHFSPDIIERTAKDFNTNNLRDLKWLLRKTLKYDRRYSAIANEAKLQLDVNKHRAVYRLPDLLTPNTPEQILETGGVSIAFVGIDGSGKSTLTRAVTDWLRWKLPVERMYLGENDTHTIPKKILYNIKQCYYSKGSSSSPSSAKNKDKPLMNTLKSVFNFAWALSVARSRRRKLEYARRNKLKGKIMIFDRYPQNQVSQSNDGPLLSHWEDSGHFFKRLLFQYERKVYELAERRPPDIIIKLSVDPENASKRGDSADYSKLTSKNDILEDLEYNTEVINVDANQSLEQVASNVKKHVWNAL